MYKAMGIYDYMNHFWFENENDPCSLSESVLYFYLLYEANRQHWVTPFKVSTQMLVARLNTSKQNVMKAKDGLRKSRATLWRWNASGYLPCYKLGGKNQYKQSDVERIDKGLK
jgi:hypothetical protein